ncbi:hypothetical protein [Mycoplasma capricolum]
MKQKLQTMFYLYKYNWWNLNILNYELSNLLSIKLKISLENLDKS